MVKFDRKAERELGKNSVATVRAALEKVDRSKPVNVQVRQVEKELRANGVEPNRREVRKLLGE